MTVYGPGYWAPRRVDGRTKLARSIADHDDTHSVADATPNATVYQVLHLSTPEIDQLQ